MRLIKDYNINVRLPSIDEKIKYLENLRGSKSGEYICTISKKIQNLKEKRSKLFQMCKR